VAGLATAFGSGAMTNSIDEIEGSDIIFVIGSNTTENHPVIGSKIKRAVNKGTKLIVADPRDIELVQVWPIYAYIKNRVRCSINKWLNSCHDKRRTV
jgi:predicted molibdopterin-dependent oxidoreductase YjgC